MQPIEELEPQPAHERLQQQPGSIYLDVRSVPEFEDGHPAGAWNVPLLHMTPMGMQPNHEFQAVCESVLPREVLIVVGCRSGHRSLTACQILQQLGFPQTLNLAGGFAGHLDPMSHRMMIPGWQACGLPTSRQAEAGRSWEELRQKALG